MEIIELLKKLKSIKPDPDYSRKSRMVVLSCKEAESRLPIFSFSLKEIASGVLHSGWSMAMVAIFLLLTIGSFSVLKLLSPATTAVVDITGLRAEAQAIDARIEFTNVVYNESVGVENKTSAPSMILRESKSTNAPAKQKEDEEIKPAVSDSPENASVQPTIDSALDILSR